MRQQRPPARMRRDEAQRAQRDHCRLILGEARDAKAEAHDQPGSPRPRLFVLDREQQPRKPCSRQRETEQQRSVRHHPAARRKREEPREIQRDNRPEAGFGAVEPLRHAEQQPGRGCEEHHERQADLPPLPQQRGGAMREPLVQGRMVEIGERELPRDRDRVDFVGAEPDRQPHRQPERERPRDDEDRGADGVGGSGRRRRHGRSRLRRTQVQVNPARERRQRP